MTILTRGAIALAGSSLTLKTGEWRLQRPAHRYRSAPCHVACPAGEDVQAYLARLAEGDPKAAWETLVRANPLPAVSGRVCPHPCESACNRRQFDEPIAIHCVERFLGDEAIRQGWNYAVAKPRPAAAPVAVVGAGPAGLSTAYHLVRRGHEVALFEGEPLAGGLLRSALPPYRLPRAVLDAEVERLLAIGIKFNPCRRLGRDFTIEELQASHAAVFLAPGAQRGREWSTDGVVPRDARAALDILKEWVSIGALPAWRRIAIIGGGNTAIDLARVFRLAGAAEVHVITFQALPGPDVAPGDAMSATEREIRQAIEEGVIIHERRGLRRLIIRGERMVGAEMVHMKEIERPDGSRRPVAFEGTETILHVDQVIPAIGQEVDPAGLEELLAGRPFFAPDFWGRLENAQGVFVGGDARASGTVSRAIGDGRRAAKAIDAYLRGTALKQPTEMAIGIAELNLNYFEHAPRAQARIRAASERTAEAEIEAGLSHAQATDESHRCFSCGQCLACDNCWTLCPDNAVLKTVEAAGDGSHYVFDYDYCKGCGLCAHECPPGYIVMEEEP
jgi:NADPH-dependent glutamate synthase beta subunit-like oxidoreductase/ferredoxin